MEVGVSFKLLTDEVLHGLKILVIVSLTDQVKDQKTLLMRDGAELESAHHVEHSLDELFAEHLTKASLLVDWATLGKHCEKSAKLFHGANTEHTGSAH